VDFSSQGWPGNGTLMNPYVIEGLNITADAVCIDISHTTVYFEVRDCMISSENESSYDGITFDDVVNGVVRDCIIDMHNRGVYLRYTPDCILTNNSVYTYTNEEFYLDCSPNCILTNNSAFGKRAGVSDGFYLHASDSCILINNSASYNDHGFSLVSSNGCTLIENSANRSVYGFYFLVAANCILERNTATRNPEPLGGYGFYTNICTNITLIDNTASGIYYGFIILGLSSNCSLINNIAYSNGIGIRSYQSQNITLMNNQAYNNLYSGFSLYRSSNCTVTSNTAYNNSVNGFDLTSTNNTVLTSNIATNNTEHGINLEIGSENNRLYLNRLGDNGVSNARDNGNLNFWDDGISQGNYWLDYNGTETYSILGLAGSVDHYPSGWEIEPTTTDTSTNTITTPDNGNDIALIVGLTGVGIVSLIGVIIIISKKQ
jgi:parallel beta-helix repeat protein